MQVWEHKDDEGRTCAIEVPSLAGRRRVARVVSRIPGAVIVRRPALLSWFDEDSFCEFELDGQRFDIHEPFGDNSRYWIGKDEFGWHPSFYRVVTAFQHSGLWFG